MLSGFSTHKFYAVVLSLTTIYLVTIYFFMGTGDDLYSYFNPTKNLSHVVIHSAFYYNISKLYAPNSVIILLNAHRDFHIQNLRLQCHSQNQTSNLTSDAQIRSGDVSGIFCQWRAHILNCTTVENPYHFGITTFGTSSVIGITLEKPETKKKYPVVMCYPQMLYESRWQQIIFATEMYRHFGADLQIQYINSAMDEIVQLLEVYERKKWVKIHQFGFMDFDDGLVSSIGYHPMLELDSRNQALGYTDCLMRYRESSEFAIVADVDDILIPYEKSFYKEFFHWSKVYPNAAAFMFYRVEAKIQVEDEFEKFSLAETIKSIKISEATQVGKSVYQTRLAETAWIHFPVLDNSSTVSVPMAIDKFYHVQIENGIVAKQYKNASKPFKPISNKDIKKLSLDFLMTFNEFPAFHSNFAYANSIYHCYQQLSTWNPSRTNESRPCLSPLSCPKPKELKGFKCKVSKRNYNTNYLTPSLILHVPSSNFYYETSEDGCNVFRNNK